MIFLVLEQANLRARWRVRRRASGLLLLAGLGLPVVAAVSYRESESWTAFGALLALCTLADVAVWRQRGWPRNAARVALLALAGWALLRPPGFDAALGFAIGGTFVLSGALRVAHAAREGPLFWRWQLAHGALACLLGIGLVVAHTANNPTPIVFAAAIEALMTAYGYARLGAFGRRRAAPGTDAYGRHDRDREGPARGDSEDASSAPPG